MSAAAEAGRAERLPAVRPARLVLASRNEKKLVELRRIFGAAGLDVELVALPDGPDVPETGTTFAENALIKARDAVRTTGLPAVADDSGLAVDELNGMPGVRSARWAGARGSAAERDAANNALLLAQLDDVPPERRGAAFVCALALVTPAGEETVVLGEARGRLLTAPRGDRGFGYDPLFVPDASADGRTNAELTMAEKDAISHRGLALRRLAALLAALPE